MVTSQKGGGGAPPPSGSPIIVDGGGSVKIKFKHADYDQNGGGDEHDNKDHNAEIAKIDISIDNVPKPPIVIPIDSKAKVTITLR